MQRVGVVSDADRSQQHSRLRHFPLLHVDFQYNEFARMIDDALIDIKSPANICLDTELVQV